MAIVEVNYPDYRKHNNEDSFWVESDKEFNPYTWRPPINWQGTFVAFPKNQTV